MDWVQPAKIVFTLFCVLVFLAVVIGVCFGRYDDVAQRVVDDDDRPSES